MQAKRLLLILDNFEHLLGGASELESMLQACDQFTLLVTSRERLQLREEQVFQIWGLKAPSAENHQASASTLFLGSARRLEPSFSPNDEDWAAIIELCQLVAGMPLALELAASWIDMLTPAEMVAEMEQ